MKYALAATAPLCGASILIGVLLSACHRLPNTCRGPSGTANVRIVHAATARRGGGADSSAPGGLVVRVFDGTARQVPLDSAHVSVYAAGAPPYGARPVVPRRYTAAGGRAAVDSLAAGAYDVRVGRLGYEELAQRVAVRAGFVDTVTFGLRTAGVCLLQ